MDRVVSLWWTVRNILFIVCCVHGASQLIFGSTGSMSIFNMDNNDVKIVTVPSTTPIWIDYHYRNGFVYWTDRSRIWRTRFSEMNSTTDQVIYQTLVNVRGLAVDYVNDKLFWSSSTRAIMMSDLDGSNTTKILDTNLNSPTDIELDLESSWMFIVDGSKIEKCKLDGSRQESLTSGVSSVYDIELDLVAKRIYWINDGTNEIKSALFNGSDVKVILPLFVPNGLDIDNDYLYISYQNHILRVDKSTGDNQTTVYSALSRIYDAKILKENVYECSKNKIIQNEDKRSAGYETDPSLDKYFNDDAIGEDWYRIISNNGDEMPNYPPGVLHCGTYHPIWLNGTLPNVENGNVTRDTCIQTKNNICNETIPIEIRNCGDFYVYHLQNTSSDSAYCFGNGPVLCPDDLSSETGYYPGCTSTFPNETVSVKVKALLIDGPVNTGQSSDTSPSLIPVFRCVFDDISDGVYVYDIYWYINGDPITKYKNMKYDDLKMTDLKHTDWIDDYKMNMKVTCAVRIRYQIGSIPGKFMRSGDFEAGFFPETYEYTVIEGESFTIRFTSTVPVGCSGSHEYTRKHCQQLFYVSQPKHTDSKGCAKHRDIAFKSHFCGISLGSFDWEEIKHLHVFGISDGLYNYQDCTTSIKLSTHPNQTDMWKDIRIPEIKVTVVDKDSVLTSRLCQSYNDPHITTFDGRVYHYMEVGEFVIYRNNRGPFWVHALFTNCGFGWKGSACHCGIAVRSRSSLFVLRTCKRISRTDKYLLDQPHTEVRSCDKKDFNIEQTGNNYKITLPIGTEIRFSMSTWDKFITSVSIKPSVYDINKAKGLCGVPNVEKDPDDDFTHRESGPITDEKRFGDSWRITSTMWDEQLFVAEPRFLYEDIVTDDDGTEEKSNATQTGYCICENQAGLDDDPYEFYYSQCNLTESTEHCSSESGDNQSNDKPVGGDFHTSCHHNNKHRRSVTNGHNIVRRSTSDSDDIVDFVPLEYDGYVNDNNATTESSGFRNGWTEEKANKTCYQKINTNMPSELFEDASNLTNTEYIKSCILDIKLTASEQFLQDTVGAMQTYTVMEVSRNESLSVTKTENGSQSVLDYITSLLCPNNCSNNGTCSTGVCSCFEDYLGDDCSMKISTPPSNISIPQNGLCGTRKRACKRTNIMGVFPSTTIWCRLRHFEVVNNTKNYTGGLEYVKADYRNAFMVTVNLEPLRKRRSVETSQQAEGVEISLSNDKKEYGDSADIIIFDEECQNCSNAPIKCVPLDDSCPLLTTKGTTKTLQTSTVAAVEISETKRQYTYRILIVVVVVITVFLIILISILVMWRIRTNKNRKAKEYKDDTKRSNVWNSCYEQPFNDKLGGVQDSLRIPRIQMTSTSSEK